jgi:cob(I)alamin adenosyltransferase
MSLRATLRGVGLVSRLQTGLVVGTRPRCFSICTPVLLNEKDDIKKVRIYTKTGDKGTSSLYTGERRPKSDPIFDALGNTDELNSSIGMAREYCLELSSKHVCDELEARLIKMQSTLLDIGSFIATPRTRADKKQLDRLSTFEPTLIKELEQWIDAYELELPPLRNFILPSGGKCAAMLHMCRSICRRLERSLQPLLILDDLDENAYKYVNRLSDFFFVAARYVSMKEGKDETTYKKPK